jgi:hypothetical protein
MRSALPTFAITLLGLAGCGSPLPPETDPAQGRQALKTVLDTWANGGTPDDLKKGSPAIVAYDPDWEAGLKLRKYEIDPADQRMGVDLLVKVTLSLDRPGNKTTDKNVNFTVAIGQQTVVLRQQ